MSFKHYIRIFIFLLGLFFAWPSLTLADNLWANGISACPTDAYSQSCVGGKKVCGLSASSVVSCADPAGFVAPAASTVNNTSVSTNGGYKLDCYSQDATTPYCDNNGGATTGLYYCYQKSACNAAKVVTNCTAGAWDTATCDTNTCLPGYRNCNADADCSDVNEHDGSTCTTSGGLPGTYSACTCVAQAGTLKLSYDSAITNPITNSTLTYPALTILNTGYVGIGTTTPNQLFQVHGVSQLDSVSYGVTPIPTQLTALATVEYVNGAGGFWSGTLNGNIWNGGAGLGNVGIGTTNPTSAKLQVDSAGVYSMSLSSSQRYIMGLKNTGDAGGGWWFGDDAGGNFFLHENGVGDRVTVQDATGNFGIGTIIPRSKLEVTSGTPNVNADVAGIAANFTAATPSGQGSTISLENNDTLAIDKGGVLGFGGRYSGASYANWASIKGLKTNSTSGNYSGYLSFFTRLSGAGSVERMRITDGGNVGIGTTNPGAYKLNVNGGAQFNLVSDGITPGTSQTLALTTVEYVNGMLGTSTQQVAGYLPLGGGTMNSGATINMNNGIISSAATITVGKINATTIDPLYSINNVNYATFAASIAGGVKEEYVGKIIINKEIKVSGIKQYEAVVDFNSESVGTDLWVWYRVVDFNKNNVEVLITPYGNFAQTYYLINDNKLIFRSSSPVEVSYRLIGRRFDWREWPTKPLDQTEKGYFVP